MDGGIAMAKKYDNVVKSASELGRDHSVFAEKYNTLCEDYDELEREYKDLCDEYYEAWTTLNPLDSRSWQQNKYRETTQTMRKEREFV